MIDEKYRRTRKPTKEELLKELEKLENKEN